MSKKYTLISGKSHPVPRHRICGRENDAKYVIFFACFTSFVITFIGAELFFADGTCTRSILFHGFRIAAE